MELEFPKSDGDILFASEANQLATKVFQVYTGNAMDTGTGTSIELNSISSTLATGLTYVKLEITAYANLAVSSNDRNMTIQIQTKEIGGAYGDTCPEKNFLRASLSGTAGGVGSTHTLTFYHTISAGEKTNGLQVKIIRGGTGTLFTNINTVQTLIT